MNKSLQDYQDEYNGSQMAPDEIIGWTGSARHYGYTGQPGPMISLIPKNPVNARCVYCGCKPDNDKKSICAHCGAPLRGLK